MDSTTTLLIAEDYLMMAEGLRKLLECDFRFVDIVSDLRDLVQIVAASKPDVLLLDIAISQVNRIDAIRRIGKAAPATKVVIVTGHNEPEYVMEAFRAGACGYILKLCSGAELVTAIRQVMNGHSYVTPLVAQHVVAAAMRPKQQRSHADLTPRQREVLERVAEGYTAKEIANALDFSVKTAVFHKMAIMDKLGLRTTAALTRYAIEHGITRRDFERVPLPLQADSADTLHEEAVAQ